MASAEYQKEWRSRNQHKLKAYRSSPEFKLAEANRHLLRTYGITLDQKQSMWNAQQGLCAVCHKPLPDVMARDCQVEHNHTTHEVRGLTHWYCNIIVGVVENHPTLLGDVEQYLQKSDAIVRPHGNNNHERLAEMTSPCAST